MSSSPLAQHWTLDPDIHYLNHGSFGATPRSVLAKQTEWRARMEAEPVRFFMHEREPALANARSATAKHGSGSPPLKTLTSNPAERSECNTGSTTPAAIRHSSVTTKTRPEAMRLRAGPTSRTAPSPNTSLPAV